MTRKYIMPKPKIIFYGLWPELKNYALNKFKGYNYVIGGDKITDKNLNKDAKIMAVFVDSKIDAKVLHKLPKLKMVAAMSTGFDHIDTKACKARGVVVSNVPTYGENTVAEHTFALILGLTRKLFRSVKRVKEGRYDFHNLRGVDLKGRTIGVIGTGHIGAHVIRMARGFEMNLLAYDVKPDKDLAARNSFSYVPLTTLLKQSDVITLHAPLNSSTHHLINKKNIKLIKPGSYLINTSRGALVEPEALAGALEKNWLAGVGLDVLEDENLIQNFEEVIKCGDEEVRTSLINEFIIHHPNAIVTPHNAFNSTEALERIVDITVENIKAFLANKPQNVIS